MSFPTGAAAEETSLTRVEVIDAHHATAVHLYLEGPVPTLHTRVDEDPKRIVVELPYVVDRSETPSIEIGSLRAERVTVERVPRGLLIVIEAGNAVDPFQGHGVSPTDDGILITVGTGVVVAAPRGEPEPPKTVATPEPGPTEAQAMGAAATGTGMGAIASAPTAEPAPAPAAELPDVAAEAADIEAAESPLLPPPPTSADPVSADGIPFEVERFLLRYAQPHPDAPSLSELLRSEVTLSSTPEGYVAPRSGVPMVTVKLSDVPGGPVNTFYSSAIRTINEHIVREFNARGLSGVLVLPAEEDIDPRSGRDTREGREELTLLIWLGRLLEFRTYASGTRVSEEERIDAPVHQRIKDRSPLQPGDLLRKRELDEYLARLNRHPGRNVETTLSSATEPGGIYLDYLVAESRPITAYFQVGNYGTKQTTEWRQRFGFQHSQLTNRDDILKLDYVTGNFDKVHAVFGSYNSPIWKWDWLRGRIGGFWSEYDASEFAVVSAEFDGELWGAGGQLFANVFQHEKFFTDVFVGLRGQHVEAKSTVAAVPTSAESDFFLPEFGLLMERITPEFQFRIAGSGEINVSSVADTDASDLVDFGRADVTEEDFVIVRWDAFVSGYLEPFINRAAYNDPSTPRSSALAHELFLGTRGQYSPDRLIPQLQRVAGGLFSVRGYEEATAAGDTTVLGRFEYRFHLPRILPIQPVPQRVPVIGDWRVAPTQVYGQPDWDLILRAFVDAGRTIQANPVPAGETDETLIGTGLGLELRLFNLRWLSNITASFDWGRALKDAREGTTNEVKAGNDQFHFLATIQY